MKNLLIFGISDAAELAYFYFAKQGKYQITGFVVDPEFKEKSTFLNLPVHALPAVKSGFPPDRYAAFVATGYSGLNNLRQRKYQWFKKEGYDLVSYVSPQAICLTDQIGDNCFIQEGCIIQPHVKIGNNVTIWSGAHIGHHSVIEDHCFIGPRASISGRVHIKEMSFIGINATIKDHVTIGRKNLVGAGALVIKNTDDATLQKGSKASSYPLTPESIKKI